MKSYYSVIYITPNFSSEERISVGLLLVTDGIPIFDYSEFKIKVAKNIIGKDAFLSIKKVLKNIKEHVSNYTLNNELQFLEGSPFSFDYTSYLHNYHNNLITYSDPSKSRGHYSKSDFSDLYKIYVNDISNLINEDTEKKVDPKKTFLRKIKESPIKDKINTFYRLTPSKISSIYTPHKVDYIGVNGTVITGNSLDFNKDPYYIERDLFLFKNLAEGINNFASKNNLPPNGKHSVYFNDPEGKKQKKILERALQEKNSKIILKHYDEFDYDEKKILKKNTMKFSSLLY